MSCFSFPAISSCWKAVVGHDEFKWGFAEDINSGQIEAEDERQHKSSIHADENLQENCQAEMVNGEKSLQRFLTRVNRTFLGEV